MINYCLPIIANDKQEVLSILHEHALNYTFVEIWLDYIDDLDEEFITQIAENYGDKLIFLFRRQNLEMPRMPMPEQERYLQTLNGTGVFVDADIEAQKELLDYIKNNIVGVKLITSYHNYKQTPTGAVLNEKIDAMRVYEPEIYKIATYCHTQGDALRLMGIQQFILTQSMKHIILGMGEYGKITRVFGTLWGNEMIFAPQATEGASAPGQLTREELERIFEILS